jgi:hypothetical protein
MRAFFIVWASVVLLSSSAFGQTQQQKYVDDGTRDYSRALVPFTDGTAAHRAALEKAKPFIVGLYGFKAMRLASLPFDGLEGANIGICGTMLSIVDDEISPVLKDMAERSKKTHPAFIDATEAEKAALQKFAVQKYYKKYVLDLGPPPVDVRKKDPLSAWKFDAGSSLGDLAGLLTQWFSLPNNAKFDATVASQLRALEKLANEAPVGVSADFKTNLKDLAKYGAQSQYSPAVQQEIGAAMKRALLSAMPLVD